MCWKKRVYLGTWQFGGEFKTLNKQEIKGLISLALSCGIIRFDTAAAYGKGSVETILGEVLPENAIIVTKIPALKKTNIKSVEPIGGYYPRGLLKESAAGSLARLGRKRVDAILLHNWMPAWNIDGMMVLKELNDLKRLGMTERVGISLPDGFESELPESLLPYVDIIEAPYNLNEYWIMRSLTALQSHGKEVLLRSLLLQGLLTKDVNERKSFGLGDRRLKSAEKISGVKKQDSRCLMRKALNLGTSVVLGMTTEDQIRENIESVSY